MNNKFYTVCGIVEINKKILLVRHTYGTAKNRLLLPGGFVCENEMPAHAAEREILEETDVTARTRSVFAVQFKPAQWCIIFEMEYIGGTPKSDNHENNEVVLISADEAVKRPDITNMSREILTAYDKNKDNVLCKSGYFPKTASVGEYEIYGI